MERPTAFFDEVLHTLATNGAKQDFHTAQGLIKHYDNHAKVAETANDPRIRAHAEIYAEATTRDIGRVLKFGMRDHTYHQSRDNK